MFGNDYYRLEEQLGQQDSYGHEFGQAEYATALLARVLDRAATLKTTLLIGGIADMTVEDVDRIVFQFCEDCEEARARAFRAGLLGSPYPGSTWTETAIDVFVFDGKPTCLPAAEELNRVKFDAWSVRYDAIKERVEEHQVKEKRSAEPEATGATEPFT